MALNPRRILYEDDHLLAVEKLSGELSVAGAPLHPSRLAACHGEVLRRSLEPSRRSHLRMTQKLSLFDFLKKQYPGLRALHRLDFETSGVVVFAKTQAVQQVVLASKFQGWKKVYRTIVVGQMPQRKGVIRVPLPPRGGISNFQFPIRPPVQGLSTLQGLERRAHGREAISKQVPNSKLHTKNVQLKTKNCPTNYQLSTTHSLVEAVTRYRVLEEFGDVSYVEVAMETGRHHQIRRHFALLGHPLVLDQLYGEKRFNRKFSEALGYRRFFLHGASLEFSHPVSKETIHIEAKLPRVFEEVLGELRGPTNL